MYMVFARSVVNITGKEGCDRSVNTTRMLNWYCRRSIQRNREKKVYGFAMR